MSYDIAHINRDVITKFLDSYQSSHHALLNKDYFCIWTERSTIDLSKQVTSACASILRTNNYVYQLPKISVTLGKISSDTFDIADSVSCISSALKITHYKSPLRHMNLQVFAEDRDNSSDENKMDPQNKSENSSDDDFIELDKLSINELELPDAFIIPVGRNRVRIKTDYFLAIIGIIIPIIFTILCDNVNETTAQLSSQEQNRLLEEQNNLLQEQNRLLSDILSSVDSTNSTQSDFIECLKRTLPKSDLIQTDSGSAPCQLQETQNSNPE